MSAIAGAYFLDDRPVDCVDLDRMVAILAHRGPDGSGVWRQGSVGVGHCLLWTTPESLREKFPLVSKAGELVLTADARIDNRSELIAALNLVDRASEEITDGDLILAAYERWGEHCPGKLLGDFAFAIWDGRTRSLFCVRDYFGIKPFYYYYQPGRTFMFASEIKALLCLPWVPRRLTEVRVADYLASLVEDKVMTFYQEILRLPPGHSMTVRREGSRLQEYWSLDPSREVRHRSDAAYAEAFRDIFAEAVRCRLRSHYPVGVALSGGLDSASVTSMARTLIAANGHPPIHTFSAVFNDVPQCDERPFINAVIAQGGVEPHYVPLDRLGALTDINQVLWHQDQPLYIRNVYLWVALFRAAQQQGVRVMLDGEDGDTVVSHGNGHLAELARTGQWAAFAGEARALFRHFESYGASPTYWLRAYGFTYLNELARAGRWITFVRASNEIARYFAAPRWKLFLNQGLRPLAPEPVQRAWRALHWSARAQVTRYSLINPRLARRVSFAERTSAMFARHTPVRSLREEHWLSLTAGITSCTHEEDNKTAAAFAIEPRHPFWDRRVVEFCLALPPEQKLRQGWPRWVLRHAMADILPEAIQWRVGKSNLSPNFTRSLLTLERERLEEVLGRDVQDLEEYVDMSVMREAYRIRHANTVWPVVILALWLRRTA